MTGSHGAPRRRAFITWIGYRLDRFLALGPLVQLGTMLVLAFFVALGFGTAIYLAEGHGEVRTVGSGLWWAVTHMLDGGTLGHNTTFRTRAFGLAVTLIGLVAVAVLTGALASSFAERVRAIRRGTLPILERGHVLLLGWNARAGVLVRELALSGLHRSVVVLTDHDRGLVEEQVREQLLGIDHHLGVVVRRGAPTLTADVRRVAARRAEAIVVLVDGDEVGGDAADRAILRSLLALRRVLGKRRLPTCVEVLSPRGQELVGLCAADEAVVVDARDSSARLLAHSVRQPGAFDVVRQILSLAGASIHAHAPRRLAGMTFDAAHAALEPGILIGVVREGRPMLSPPGSTVIARDDRLLVFEHPSAEAQPTGELPEIDASEGKQLRVEPRQTAALQVLVIRHRPEIVSVLDTLADCARGGACVTVLVAEAEREVAELLARTERPGTRVEVVVGDPLGGAVLDAALARAPDVVLLLAADVPSANLAEADAEQLITLLQVQRGAPADTRIVAEIRSPETARLAGGTDARPLAGRVDFLLSNELVGMLLAQQTHLACLRARHRPAAAAADLSYEDVFDEMGASIRIEPLSRYAAGHELPSFGFLLAAARRLGEVALGVVEGPGLPATGERVAAPSVCLLPRRDERFEPAADARLIVISPPVEVAPAREAARAAALH